MNRIFLSLLALIGIKPQSSESKNVNRETGFVYTSNGVDYPIWETPNGSFYTVLSSKNTGKNYRKYLPKEKYERLKSESSSQTFE